MLSSLFSAAEAAETGAPDATVWRVPDVGALPDDARGRQIRRGRDLVTQTYALLGPDARDPADRFLAATAKVYGLSLVTADENFARSKDFSVVMNR